MNTPADSAAVRRHNLGLALRHIADHSPVSRTQVAAATGLVHGSVSGLVADLAARGLVREDGVSQSGGRGRPRRVLRLVPERVTSIAVQITLERLRVLVADLAGTPVLRTEIEHRSPAGDPETLASAVAEAVRLAQREASTVHGAHLARVVVAMAAPVTDDAAHTVVAATDFGWAHSTDLGALISDRLPGLPCPLDVVNDANAAALAEYHARTAARGGDAPRSLAYLKADTGVGGGVIVEGRVHGGSHGIAGEPGHVPVSLDGPPCPCGARGCLAMYAGPEALAEAAGLATVLERDGKDAALDHLDRALRAGDARAARAVHGAGDALGVSVLGIAGLLDVEVVVFGGYFADWFEWLAPRVDAVLAGRRALVGAMLPDLVPGALRQDATLAGAVGFAREAVLTDPTTVPVLTAD